MQDLQIIQNFFNTKTKENGHSIKSLDWGSKRTQELRFYIFSEIANLDNKSILDVGCGFADFFYFLKDKLGLNIKYTGIDISSEVIQEVKKLDKDINVKKADILNDELEQYDYVFGSGIHNIKVKENYDLLQQMLKRMFELAKYGVATNMINDKYSQNLAKHIFSYNKERVLNFAKSLSDYTVLREDYLPHDFTLFLYKNDWATRNNYEEN